MNSKTENVRPRTEWALNNTLQWDPEILDARVFHGPVLHQTFSKFIPAQLRVNENKSLIFTLPPSTRISLFLEPPWWISETLTIKAQCIALYPEIRISYLYTYNECLVNIFYMKSKLLFLMTSDLIVCMCVYKN